MKIWLDDVRDPPNSSWTHALTAEEAIDLLEHNIVTDVSLDHDLGEEKDGNDVLTWLFERSFVDPKFHVPSVIGIHTMNPVERVRMIATAQQIRDVEFVYAESPKGKRY